MIHYGRVTCDLKQLLMTPLKSVIPTSRKSRCSFLRWLLKSFIKISRVATGKQTALFPDRREWKGTFLQSWNLMNDGGLLRWRCLVFIAGICRWQKMNVPAFEMSHICWVQSQAHEPEGLPLGFMCRRKNFLQEKKAWKVASEYLWRSRDTHFSNS